MKKFLSLLMMTLLCVSAWAATVTYTFNTDAGLQELGITKPNTSAATNLSGEYALGDVTLSFTNGGTATRIWNAQGNTDLRIYNNGGSITLEVPADMTITEIAFTSANSTSPCPFSLKNFFVVLLHAVFICFIFFKKLFPILPIMSASCRVISI